VTSVTRSAPGQPAATLSASTLWSLMICVMVEILQQLL
jgi:hypothetical protein